MKLPHTPLRAALVVALSLVPLARLGSASDIAVFGETDTYDLGATPVPAGPKEPDRMAFFEAYKADSERGAPLEKTLPLINPPEWGKTVSPATAGTLAFHPSVPGGFACHISLENLLPEHAYILTLNGNPAKAGNNLLGSSVPGNAQEKYYDFLIVRTDAHGHYDSGLGVCLKPGSYDVRCYVKDTGDFKIVLYHDFFGFLVR
ncbi:MAG TPA: hypothetical protein VII09_02305 [Opitutaceae bacterium]